MVISPPPCPQITQIVPPTLVLKDITSAPQQRSSLDVETLLYALPNCHATILYHSGPSQILSHFHHAYSYFIQCPTHTSQPMFTRYCAAPKQYNKCVYVDPCRHQGCVYVSQLVTFFFEVVLEKLFIDLTVGAGLKSNLQKWIWLKIKWSNQIYVPASWQVFV